jgi:phosphoadenosine phosphosulfate reductase
LLKERTQFDDLEIGELAVEFDDQEPEDVIEWALETFGDDVAIVTALQTDGMVILDMAYQINPDVRVVTVDTGRLPQASHEFLDEVHRRYPEARFDIQQPDQREVETLVRRNGPDLFRESVPNRLLCCQIRKVRPLVRALEGLDAWFTGLRRDQWASRAAIRKIELDHDHDGIVKLNPLADWTKEEVWDPCTRPVREGDDDRAGRWWWETNAPKECGMHCPIETGGFEHEVHAILGEAHDGDH